MSRRKIDVFSPKKIASNSDLEEKDFRLSVKMLFGGLVKTAFNLSLKHFFFQKKSLIQVIFVVLRNFFRLFVQKFSASFLEVRFLCPEEHLEDFLQKKTLSILDINWHIISTMAKFSWQAWQKSIPSVHETFWRNLILR